MATEYDYLKQLQRQQELAQMQAPRTVGNPTAANPNMPTITKPLVTNALNNLQLPKSTADQMHDLYNQIANRGPFRYDATTDPMYQAYAQMYARQGKRAMQDTIGQAANLTGGYTSSYANAAGQEAYDRHLEGLTDVQANLYSQARQAWGDEGDRLMQQYGMLGDKYNREIAEQQYNDQLAWQQQQFEYQQGQDQLDRDWKQQQFEYQQGQDQLDRDWKQQQVNYQMAMEMIQTGAVPGAALLQAAGIDPAWAKQMAAWYKNQLALAGGSGSGGGSRGRSGGGSSRRYYIKDSDKDSDKDSGASGNPLAAMVSGGVNGLSSVLSQTSEPDIPQAELVNWAKKLGNARGDSKVFAQFKQRYGDGKKARAAWKWIGEHYMDYFRGYAKAPNN